REVKLIDFGISSKIDLRETHLGNPERLEGTLAYNSPEQTGRMNRVVDYRTDLYSMGVMFYEMLSGQLPFPITDAMELVHSHIAITPTPVCIINPSIPKPISDIIDVLLSKNAEDRYQSALGVKHDLSICLEQYENNRRIKNFALRKNDFSGKFQVSQHLYGREKEIQSLIDAFERCSQGAVEMMLVAGYSGTGKSAMVREVHKPITKKRGYFIGGKYDQFQRAVPYYAILQGFGDFVSILLTEKEEKLSRLREEILNAVGAEGKVLTDLIPNLEHIIGIQPEVPEIGGTESQNRFNYVFRKFVKAIATREHPLVLFIDDLQWADSASLNLLDVLLTDLHISHFLCIGAYRDNEVTASHPFIITKNSLETKGAKVCTVTIGNLSKPNVKELIDGSVNISGEDTHSLTDLVYEKTQGNAFFVNQFLKSLYQEQLLSFNFTLHRWEWNIQKVREQNITDNVVELMAGKILRLPTETQKVMKLAACIGNVFDIATLAVIYQKNEAETSQDFFEGLREGLLVPSGDKVRFSHDRIQQAVYSLIPNSEKNQVHLSIGKLMLSEIATEQQEEKLFDIVNQWNLGKDILSSAEEKELLARLNLRAGIRAKQTSAFKPAFDYFETGIQLLQQDPWLNQYELCRDLYTHATEAAYLNADFAVMDKMYKAVLSNARDLLEKVKPYEIRILAYKAENKLLDAIQTGLEVLSQLGEKFPARPGMLHVMTDLVKTKIKLGRKNNETLQALPVMENEYKIAAMRIMADIASSSYWATPT
ncbi:MAG: AAA family ATPase, partial [Bacteroidota bacterium]|nr:AAA family ATPase [Bacteroidota bacterium]